MEAPGAAYEPVGLCFLDRPSVRDQLRLAARAEVLGYSSVWVAESRLVRDAVSVAGAIAANTSRITVGALINSWTRGPDLVATTLATLDELAPGRVSVAVGPYWEPLASKQGVHRQAVGTQMRKFLHAVQDLLSLGGRVTIYVLGADREMVEIGAEVANGVLLNGLMSTDYTRAAQEWVAAGAARAERDPAAVDRPQLVNVAMSDPPDVARDAVRRLAAIYLAQQPHFGEVNRLDPGWIAPLRRAVGGWPARRGGVERGMRFVDDATVDMLAVAGTPEECRRRLPEWVEAGASYPIVVPVTDNADEICEALAPGLASRAEAGKTS